MVLYNRIFKTGSETVGTLFQFVATVMDYDYAKSKLSFRLCALIVRVA